ncbi:hypothetical protein PIB30_068409 [Stylosanthes scabra]|uniref:Uncharacterized protein n=1 Tax=Stylosanthes scabra TaxID=79078 RepID=A0ABU6ZLJ7_9FABA|nr:hypothetical protein [Stylosanthes scabra]
MLVKLNTTSGEQLFGWSEILKREYFKENDVFGHKKNNSVFTRTLRANLVEPKSVIYLLFDEKLIHVLGAIKPTESDKCGDQIAWLRSSNGSFSIKSAYSVYLDDVDESAADLFQKVWKLEAPQRLRTFCYL